MVRANERAVTISSPLVPQSRARASFANDEVTRYSAAMTHTILTSVRARLLPMVSAAAVVAGLACAPPSQQDIQTAQALSDLGVAFTDIQLQLQELQDQSDSLRLVVVRQDSVIRTLANLAGVQVPP